MGSTSTQGQDASDPLLQAIADVRLEINRLIDDQLARLSALEAQMGESASPAPASEPAAATRFAGAPLPPLAAEPPPRRSARPAPLPEPLPLGPTTPANGPTAPANGPASANDDPRERLDALAKRLDGRLRRGGGPSGERPPAEGKW